MKRKAATYVEKRVILVLSVKKQWWKLTTSLWLLFRFCFHINVNTVNMMKFAIHFSLNPTIQFNKAAAAHLYDTPVRAELWGCCSTKRLHTSYQHVLSWTQPKCCCLSTLPAALLLDMQVSNSIRNQVWHYCIHNMSSMKRSASHSSEGRVECFHIQEGNWWCWDVDRRLRGLWLLVHPVIGMTWRPRSPKTTDAWGKL